MTDTQRGMILLMKSAVTGDCYPLPESFSLEEAAALARKHHIIPLIYTGAVNCGISSKTPVMQKLFPICLQLLMRSEAQQQQIGRISDAFQKESIDFMPLKGSNIKSLYPKPELRYMGDADILIRMEQYPRIRPIMESLGFTEKDESDHELVWDHPALHLELHRRLVPSCDRDFYSFFGDGWGMAQAAEGTRYTLNPEDEYLFLFTHFTKHYRYGGIGCRHVLDLWIWRRNYTCMDEEYIRNRLESMGLLTFYNHVSDMIAFWFEDAPESPMNSYITEFILSCGSWGTFANMVQSIALRDSENGKLVRTNHTKHIIRSLFPPVSVVSLRYPVLKRFPWLLPVFWPVRWITALLFRRDRIRNEKEYQQTVAPDLVKARREALKHVGLDFQF